MIHLKQYLRLCVRAEQILCDVIVLYEEVLWWGQQLCLSSSMDDILDPFLILHHL